MFSLCFSLSTRAKILRAPEVLNIPHNGVSVLQGRYVHCTPSHAFYFSLPLVLSNVSKTSSLTRYQPGGPLEVSFPILVLDAKTSSLSGYERNSPGMKPQTLARVVPQQIIDKHARTKQGHAKDQLTANQSSRGQVKISSCFQCPPFINCLDSRLRI